LAQHDSSETDNPTQPHPRTVLLNAIASVVAFTGLIASITGVAFSSHASSRLDINSWTCQWFNPPVALGDIDGNLVNAPLGFGRVCTESRTGFALLGILIGVECVMGAATAAGWWLERKMAKVRETADMELEKVQETTK
jgi:hypothetical protein